MTKETEDIVKFMGLMTAKLENITNVLSELKAASDLVHKDVSDLKIQSALQAAASKALHKRQDQSDIKIDDHEKKLAALRDLVIKDASHQKGVFDAVNWIWGAGGGVIGFLLLHILKLWGVL